MRQSHPALLLTRRDGPPREADPDLPCLFLDDLLHSRPAPPRRRHFPRLPGSALAYQINTSGSTGQPKGVLLTRQALANLAHQQGSRLGIAAGARVLQWAAASFDASLSEVVVTLLHGATLCLSPEHALLVGARLHDELLRQAITLVTLPPTVLGSLPPGVLDRGTLPHLRQVLLAGESWAGALVGPRAGRVQVYNAYGPSEACVCASMGRWQGEARPGLGEPLGHTQVYVLDRWLRPVGVGGVGEICLGGVGVGRGYRGAVQETAEGFVPDPWSACPGSRLYRTGDLGYVGEGGRVEYRGRRDQQVKVRGYRIELGEIEQVVSAQEGVREAVAVVQGEGEGRGVVVYVQGVVQVERVRAGVKQWLPGYLQPGRYVVCEQWPLTSSGKVDRQALARGWEPVREVEEAEEQEWSALERRVGEIWREVLGGERVGVQESFFEVGGHSLLAVRLLARVRGVLGVELALERLFERPTIAGLASAIEHIYQQEQRERERLAALLQNLEQLSDEEVALRLSREKSEQETVMEQADERDREL
jgi:amino acid adenylation domain-containing protein